MLYWLILYIAFLMSGSIFLIAKYDLKFVYGLPLTVTLIVFTQYTVGIFGSIERGFYAAAVLCLCLFGIGIGLAIKEGKWKKCVCGLFDRGFWTFILIIGILLYVLYGMKMSFSDEYSYWGKVVKGMIYWDDFSTNPVLQIGAFNYPPGIALFQYFLEKIFILSGGSFAEWLMYLSKDLIYISFLLPLIHPIKGKSHRIIVLVFFILLPFLFYRDFYTSLYGDAFMGALTGCALMSLFVFKNWYGTLYVASADILLALIKPQGIVYSVVIIICYITVRKINRDNYRPHAFQMIAPASFAFFCYMLWQIKIKLSGRPPILSENKIDVGILLNVICGNDKSYRVEVYHRFTRALVDTDVVSFINMFLGNGHKIAYIYVLLFMVVIGVVIYILIMRCGDNQYETKVFLCLNIIAIIHLIIFNIGLLLTYMFKFIETQAIELMSYDRYVNALYLYILMMFSYVFFYVVDRQYSGGNGKQKCYIFTGTAVVLLAVLFPWRYLTDLLSRSAAEWTICYRQPYSVCSEIINKYVDSNQKVYFICQDNRSWYQSESKNVVAFETYPISYKAGGNYFTQDVSQWFTTDMNAGELWENLMEESISYVYIHRVDQYFIENFSSLFDEGTILEDDTIYKVEESSKKLVKCE